MTTRTIDILLNLQAKPAKGMNELTKEFGDLEKKAKSLQKSLDHALSVGVRGAEITRLKKELSGVKGEIAGIDVQARKLALAKSLKDAGDQAQKTEARMQKLAQVGPLIAIAGGLIVAPFALAMKKYTDTVGATESTSKRILELQQKWEKSQVRIGRVTAEIVLPALETALTVVDKIAAFAEAHPDAIKAAVGIGGTLVVLGGMLSTAATIVSTIATVQGLAAGIGIGGGAASAAAGTVGTVAAVELGAGTVATLGASISAAVAAAAPFVLIAAAVAVAAEGTRQLVNYALGTNTTWSDIGTTLKQLLVVSGVGWKLIFSAIGGGIKNIGIFFADLSAYMDTVGINIAMSVGASIYSLGGTIYSLGASIVTGISGFGSQIYAAIVNLGSQIVSGIGNAIGFGGGRADGGYVGSGVYRMGERGSEFVLSNGTTRAAENAIGGQLTQQRLMQGLSGGGSRVSYYDARRFTSQVSAADRRMIADETINAITGAL